MICGQNIVKHSSLGLSRDPVVGRRNSSRQDLLQVGKLIVARQIHGFDLLLLSAVQRVKTGREKVVLQLLVCGQRRRNHAGQATESGKTSTSSLLVGQVLKDVRVDVLVRRVSWRHRIARHGSSASLMLIQL